MTDTKFKDYFSTSAAAYAEFRPKYPAELFDFVASLPEQRRAAWDCATGNGQAAVPLAAHFDRVVATDGSAEQIAHATPHERVTYSVALADSTGLEAGSIDLVTVAQALHWFPLEQFFVEVKRVTARGGALAIWCYTRPVLDDDLDPTLVEFYSGRCGPYWPPDRKLVDEGYRTIAVPIDEVKAPSIHIEDMLTLAQFGGYLRTWSAARKLAAAIGRDPVVDIEDAFSGTWNVNGDRRLVRWPIHFRVGRVLR